MQRLGKSSDADWYVTSCGDGSASVAGTPDGPAVRARLVNGRWTMDEEGNAALCLDGSVVPNSETSHCAWDPYTLAGTVQVIEKFAVCGASSPFSFSNTLQLRHVA